MFADSMRAYFDENGYVVVRQLFGPQEVAELREHYMHLRASGSYPGDLVGVDANSSDPLKRYPRMIHMHHWDGASRKWLLLPRLNELLTGLLGREPYAVQTMLTLSQQEHVGKQCIRINTSCVLAPAPAWRLGLPSTTATRPMVACRLFLAAMLGPYSAPRQPIRKQASPMLPCRCQRAKKSARS